MSDNKHREDPAASDPPGTGSSPDGSRRRFTAIGLGAPVILTLFSRPVWGQVNCSLSGEILSGNVSDAQDQCTAGFGCTPGFWKNNPQAWGCTGYSPGTCAEFDPRGTNCQRWDGTTGTQFAAVLGRPSAFGDSLMEVLNNRAAQGSLDWHMAAAALGAACTSFDYGVTVEQLRDAYNIAQANGQLAQLKDILDYMNNRGCPIDSHGNCEAGFTTNEAGDCIPVIPFDTP
jgi:hypothetical protein